jgi:hypothetical protein
MRRGLTKSVSDLSDVCAPLVVVRLSPLQKQDRASREIERECRPARTCASGYPFLRLPRLNGNLTRCPKDSQQLRNRFQGDADILRVE